jgi:tRNA (adenine22-N1)-methyltransferase
MRRIQELANIATGDYQVIYDLCCDHGQIGLEFSQKYPQATLYFIDAVKEIIQRLEYKLTSKHHHAITADVGAYQYPNLSNALIVIAGVGTHTIISALDNLYSQGFDGDLIVCTHKNQLLLREYLIDRDCRLINERIIKDNKQFYEILFCNTQKGELITRVGSKMWHNFDEVTQEYHSKIVELYKLKSHKQKDDKFTELLQSLAKLRC